MGRVWIDDDGRGIPLPEINTKLAAQVVRQHFEDLLAPSVFSRFMRDKYDRENGKQDDPRRHQ